MRRLPFLVVLTLMVVGGLAPSTLAAPTDASKPASSASQTIGAGSCVGANACTNATGNIGTNSCIGDEACMNSSSNIGNNSCSENENPTALKPCKGSLGTIGNHSCNGNGACSGINATIGDDSCNSGSTCAGFVGQIGNGSCNVFASCIGRSGTVGNNACNGNNACQSKGSLNVPDNSCNGDYACLGVMRIVYVTPTGAGAKNGTSWSNAYDGLANALNGSFAGSEIWVAAGTYLPRYDPLDLNPRNTSFGLRAGTWVYGGFAGTETLRDQRDWVANVTVLSGDIGVAGDSNDNSRHVVRGAKAATLDGFTVTDGNATGDYIADSTAVQGGGVLTEHDMTLCHLTIAGNYADHYGGGIYAVDSFPFDSTTVTICSSVISGNSSGYGGAIYANSANVNLYGVTISGNSVYGGGGGISVNFGTAIVHNSVLWNDSPDELSLGGGSGAQISHSDIQGGLPSGATDGGGNLASDPMFVSPAAAASAPTTSGDYHLGVGSPAINAGSNALTPTGLDTDIDGDARILSGTVDMGADEVRSACEPGYWSSSGDDRTSSCTPAAVGFYVDQSGATNQTACPDYKTTTTTGSDSLADCVAVSPYALKQAAVSELEALLPTGSAEADRKLNKAIANITASLASWRWIDADSLSPLHGFRVFNKERHAVTWLWTGVLRANPSWSAVVNDAINRLVNADREVVVTAIAESTDSNAIAKANAKLAQADALIAQHQRAKAIYKLRAAWLAVN